MKIIRRDIGTKKLGTTIDSAAYIKILLLTKPLNVQPLRALTQTMSNKAYESFGRIYRLVSA